MAERFLRTQTVTAVESDSASAQFASHPVGETTEVVFSNFRRPEPEGPGVQAPQGGLKLAYPGRKSSRWL